jgi:hypothetical protein
VKAAPVVGRVFVVVEGQGSRGSIWYVLSGADGHKVLKPYVRLEDACQVAGEAQAIPERTVATGGAGR